VDNGGCVGVGEGGGGGGGGGGSLPTILIATLVQKGELVKKGVRGCLVYLM